MDQTEKIRRLSVAQAERRERVNVLIPDPICCCEPPLVVPSLLYSSSTMSLSNPGVRLLRLFLAFAAFAPRALAQFGSCQPGWEWVSDPLDLPIPISFGGPGGQTNLDPFPLPRPTTP